MKSLLNILKWFVIVILVLFLLIILFFFCLSKRPFVPSNYTQTVQTGGTLEAKYLANGSHQVKYTDADAPEDWGKYVIYYPAELETDSCAYPVVIFANGTGVAAPKYPALFQHLASWGFIVAGNSDPSTCTGDSVDATLNYLLAQNDLSSSIFYQKIDTAHIGLSGHSQGGVAVFNAVTQQPNGYRYTCAVSLSPTDPTLADLLNLHYDPAQMSIPTLLLASDANDVIAEEGMQTVFHAIPAAKAAACRTRMDHGKMLYAADGYVTAWFMYYLQGDEEAGAAFFGEDAEILHNALYQQVE